MVGHHSAFGALYGGQESPSILLNGRGDITKYSNTSSTLPIPTPYTLVFEPSLTSHQPKRYLLRLINTSQDTTFVFSIDNHRLKVIGADFVAIRPYSETSILVGIGQRYHVIVEADPEAYDEGPPPADDNF